MSIKQQSGFGLVPIILIVAAVAVLGFVGYKVYTAQSNKPATNNVTTNSKTSPASSQPSSTQASTTPATQTDPNAGYVVIKEWGVRFKPIDGLSGVTTITVSSNRPNAEEVMFMTSQMSAVNIPACNGQASGSRPLGAMVRTKIAEDMSQPDHDQLLKQIGDYFYYYYQPAGLCDTDANSDSVNTLQNNTLSQIKSSLDSLEAAK